MLLLGTAVPLIIGAEPVMWEVPRPPVRPEIPDVEPSPPPEPMPQVVEDIPELLEMMDLPGGTFFMGSAADDAQAYDSEKPQHDVTVSGFAIGRYAVTRELYREVVKDSPRQWEEGQDDAGLPANDVTWFDAVTFCNQLSERQGLTTCYRIDDTNVSWHRDANGYRLPTEAEWEYAARAGTQTRWFCGDEPTELAPYAWFDEGVRRRPHSVCKKMPNPWGLYDMAGNVYEWCWDWYREYDAVPVTDPSGPANGVRRVLRGGTYMRGVRNLWSANRLRLGPEDRDVGIGFRVVRRPRRQP